MTKLLSPPETIVAAMPGTLAELAAATGYPPAQVIRLIGLARRDGWTIRATNHPRSEDGSASTIFEEVPDGS